MDVLLFALDPGYASAALGAGMSGIVVDWEWRGKVLRQEGAGTEINRGTTEDLARMRSAITGHLICRINNEPSTRIIEAQQALELGANEIWLPMVRDLDEVVECLRAIDGKAELGVLVETRAALELGRELSKLPLARVFAGLNDLRLDTGGIGLFDPLVNGMIDRFRDSYEGRFGFGGITRLNAGWPVPQRILLAEMARLRCDFGVARRSFRADVGAGEIAGALSSIDAEMERLKQRGLEDIALDHARLKEAASASVEMAPRGAGCVS